MIGIYKIENLVNGKVYIGSTTRIEKRFKEHYNNLCINKHGNEYLQKDWNEYGEENFKFDIIEECSLDRLIEREQYWIDNNIVYNIREAGSKGHHSEETKQKLSNAHKGKCLSEQTKQKISISSKSKTFTLEQRIKISNSNKITHNTLEYKLKQSNNTKKQWENPEYREMMTNLWKGKHHTEETKQKMKKNHADVSGKNNPMYGKGKKVCMIDPNTNEIIKIFPSVLQAANETNNGHNNIRNYCSKDKTLNGYKWRYINE